LNQPLASILSNTETLEIQLGRRATPEELATLVADIKRDDERAGDIIRKIRALYASSKIELAPVDINELVEETARLFRGMHRGSGRRVQFRLSSHPDLPLVPADRLQLQQVLFNLISNSVEIAGDHAAVEISTGLTDDRRAEIVVRDFGPGVPEQDVPRLFQPYFSNRPGGTGLGLAISRKIVEAHGGTLAYARHPEGGSVFSIRLSRQGG
jgi:signal transduction histidine kinase